MLLRTLKIVQSGPTGCGQLQRNKRFCKLEGKEDMARECGIWTPCFEGGSRLGLTQERQWQKSVILSPAAEAHRTRRYFEWFNLIQTDLIEFEVNLVFFWSDTTFHICTEIFMWNVVSKQFMTTCPQTHTKIVCKFQNLEWAKAHIRRLKQMDFVYKFL